MDEYYGFPGDLVLGLVDRLAASRLAVLLLFLVCVVSAVLAVRARRAKDEVEADGYHMAAWVSGWLFLARVLSGNTGDLIFFLFVSIVGFFEWGKRKGERAERKNLRGHFDPLISRLSCENAEYRRLLKANHIPLPPEVDPVQEWGKSYTNGGVTAAGEVIMREESESVSEDRTESARGHNVPQWSKPAASESLGGSHKSPGRRKCSKCGYWHSPDEPCGFLPGRM